MHVAITGASAGIGEAVARAFAAQGESVTLVARREPLLQKLAGELSVPTHVEVADLSDLDHCCDWIAPAEAALGSIDVLVNNAGILAAGPTHQISVEEAERVLRVNLLAPMRITRAVLPAMLERRSGTLVDVASVAAFLALPGTVAYAASKAGLAAASETLRMELRRTGVHIVTVYPGPITTALADISRTAYVPDFRQRLVYEGRPDTLADLIVSAVRRRQPRVIFPRAYAIARPFAGPLRSLLARIAPDFEKPVHSG